MIYMKYSIPANGMSRRGLDVKLLLAADKSIYSRAALDSILACPWPPGTEFLVLSVAESYHPRTDYWNPRSRELLVEHETRVHAEHEELARSFARQLEERFPGSTAQAMVVEGHVVDKILEVADNWGAELIVVGSHGLKGFSRFLLGSVSEAVASHAKASVRVIRLPAGSN